MSCAALLTAIVAAVYAKQNNIKTLKRIRHQEQQQSYEAMLKEKTILHEHIWTTSGELIKRSPYIQKYDVVRVLDPDDVKEHIKLLMTPIINISYKTLNIHIYEYTVKESYGGLMAGLPAEHRGLMYRVDERLGDANIILGYRPTEYEVVHDPGNGRHMDKEVLVSIPSYFVMLSYTAYDTSEKPAGGDYIGKIAYFTNDLGNIWRDFQNDLNVADIPLCQWGKSRRLDDE